jgi:hypothetical protein
VTDEALRELYRARWRRARKPLKLVDTQSEDFATGGLGRHVEHLSVRLVILPGNPEQDAIDFDQRLWSWLKGEFDSPFEGQSTDWGQHILPTTAAAVRCLQISADRWSWDSNLALYRHGGLDMGFGVEGGRDIEGNRRAFWLLRIVGRVWAALHLYGARSPSAKPSALTWEISAPAGPNMAIRARTRGRVPSRIFSGAANSMLGREGMKQSSSRLPSALGSKTPSVPRAVASSRGTASS